MLPPSRQLPRGTRLDEKWEIEHPLGEGGAATVYAAKHARNGLPVAVKVLHGEIASNLDVRTRFLREGYVANRVEHPGTVRVLDDGVTPDGTVYLVMERLSGLTLDALADHHGGALPATEVARFGDRLLDVLAAAHARGIVHRDLKPENVFVCVDGSLKVLDFGIARVQETQGRARMTMQNVSMGPPAFMPPEQALGRWDQVDARSDVFALGATLFTLLTGRLVHEAATMQETMVLVSTRPVAPVRSVAPFVPEQLALVVDRALAFHRDRRWPDAAAMLAAFRAAVAASPHLAAAVAQGPVPLDPVFVATTARPARDQPSVITTRPVARNAGPARSRSFVVGAIAVAGALLAAGGIVLGVSGSSDTERLPVVTASAAAAPAPAASEATHPNERSAAEPASASPQDPPASASAPASAQTAAPAVPSLPPAKPVTKPTAPALCKRDAFTMRCPCARCE